LGWNVYGALDSIQCSFGSVLNAWVADPHPIIAELVSMRRAVGRAVFAGLVARNLGVA
jgi:hypothetical protein